MPTKFDFLEVLDVLLPSISEALITPECAAVLRHTASFLPPITMGFFECRLAENSPQVDLVQIIKANDSAIAARYLTDYSPDHVLWSKVSRLIHYWNDHIDELRTSIPSIVFEIDCPLGAQRIPIPLVFIEFSEQATRTSQLDALLSLVLDLLTDKPELATHLRRGFPPPDATHYVHYVGVMLGRQVDILRLNIRGLTDTTLPTYLETIGWEGSHEELRKVFHWLSDYSDRIVLGFDIGETVGLRVNIEVEWDWAGKGTARFLDLLDDLVTGGLLVSDKREALKRYQKTLTPLNNHIRWPDHLIFDSLLRPKEDLSMFMLWLNHLKLAYVPNEALIAKAYPAFAYVYKTMMSPEK